MAPADHAAGRERHPTVTTPLDVLSFEVFRRARGSAWQVSH
jgi:hypothetical protein